MASSSDPPGPRPLPWRRVASALALAVLLAASVELGARAVRAAGGGAAAETDAPLATLIVPDAELGWRGAPNLRTSVVGPSRDLPLFRYHVETDGEGFRGRPLPPGPSGEDGAATRLLVLGDSFAWGWGVEREEAFPQVLEAELGAGFEVYDLGVIGYSTDQMLLLFSRYVQRIAPDLVLVTLLLNDIEGDRVGHNYGLDKPRLVPAGAGAWRWEPPASTPSAPSWLARLGRRSAAVSWLRAWRSGRERVALLPPERADLLRRQPWRVYAPAEVEAFVASLARETSPTRELVRRLRAVAERFGARVILVPIPHLHDQQLYVPERLGAATREEAASSLSAAVARMAGELGVGVCAVDGALYDLVRAGKNLNVGDGHLTAEGHRAIAGRLREAVRATLDGALSPRAAERRGGAAR